MRPVEVALLVTLLVSVVVPRLHMRPSPAPFRKAIPALLVLLLLLHLALEGWRTQMLSLYALAGLQVVRSIRINDAHTGTSRWRWLRPTLGLVLIGLAALPALLMPVFALPSPTGPYAVGVTDRELLSRVNGRHLMASVWYPAATRTTRPAPLTSYPQALAAGLTATFGVPWAAPLLQHLRYIKTSAGTDVALAGSRSPFPVLVFSHGLAGVRVQNAPTFQELASQGYVVVALDHTGAAAVTVLRDGTRELYDLSRFDIRPEDIDRSTALLLPYWVADQQAVYDAVERWNQRDPLLMGKLDLSRRASFGHSFGGVTAMVLCQEDPRCQAAANLDGGFPSLKLAVQRPLLLMTASGSNALPDTVKRWQTTLESATGPALWLELPRSNHYSLTIVPFVSPLLALNGDSAEHQTQVVNLALTGFFNHTLNGAAPSPARTLEASGRVIIRYDSEGHSGR